MTTDIHTVCPLGQGTWQMGRTARLRKEEIAALRLGVELGMKLIDTAEMYDNEALVGKAIADIRDQVFLVSKVLPHHADKAGTKAACERSLKRLGTDRLDLYLLHWHSPFPAHETVAAMHELCAEGKILSWGVSNLDVSELTEYCNITGSAPCCCNQILYNPEYRGAEFDLLPMCRAGKIAVMAYSPIGQGSLLRHPVLQQIAQKHHVDTAQVVLAWLLKQGVIAIPKSGSIKHVQSNSKSLHLQLDADDLTLFDKAFPPPRTKIPLHSW